MLRAVDRQLPGSRQSLSHSSPSSRVWLAVALILGTLPLLARPADAQHTTKQATHVIPNFGGGDSIPPVISFTPAGGNVPSQTAPVTISWCDNKNLLSTSRHIYLDGGEVTSSFNYTSTTIPGCTAAAKSTGNVLLHQGKQSDTLLAVIEDNAFNQGRGTVAFSYVYAPPAPQPAYSVAVTPDNGQVIVAGGSSSAAAFAVHNTSRNIGSQLLTYTLSASCTGAAFPSGCSVVPGSTSLSADSGRVATVSFTAGAAGTTGRIRLLATQSGQPTVSDSGWVAVTASTLIAGAPSVDVASVNSGTISDRNLCLTVAAAENAARECGDLRIVHVLPAVRTMNKLRTPYLIYNSQFAHPFPIVAANVGLSGTTLPPDTIVATLTVAGVNYPKRMPATGLQAGLTRRVAVSFDGIATATGVYPYTLTVSTIYNALHAQYSTAVNDTLVVVNRAHSPFGAGWWFEGLEQLYFVTGDTTSTASKILWVGGDGSARLYARTPNGKWAARALDRPDTLARVGSTWVRYATHGAQVQFNGAGLHITTTNRLGHATVFGYSGSVLTSVTFPTPAGTGSIVKDALVYSAGFLNSISSPGGTATARTTNVAITNGHLMSITDPDTATVSFTYQTNAVDSGRIATRTNSLGFATGYGYDAAHRLISDSLDMGMPAQAIVQRFRDVDSAAFAATPLSVAPESAYVRLDGPRSDTRDFTSFWLDRYGEPTRIVDALGDTTQLARTDNRWPALITRVQYADGGIVGATYSARGNDSTSTDSSLVQGGQYATTRYLFDIAWDYVTRIVQPMGDSVLFSYDAVTGNRLYQQTGGDIVRRITFGYDVGTKLLRSIQAPVTAMADSLYYDGNLGNDSVHVSPRGIRVYFLHDLAGRIVHTKSPIDSSQSLFKESDIGYDAVDRITSEQNYGPAIHYFFRWATGSTNGITTLAERTIVNSYFDHEGNLDSLSRSSQPDTARIGMLTTRWTYDRANRVIKEIAPDGKADSTGRDPAGNALVVKSRRFGTGVGLSDSVNVITMQYDAINRVIQRQVPAVLSPIANQKYDSTVTPTWLFPRYTKGYFIPSDVESYAYDAIGHLISAVNASALVSRTYNRDGTLATDTLRIRAYSSTDSSQHVYGLRYAYDLDGRRTSLNHPDALAPLVGGVHKDSQSYGYDSVTAALASVTDVLGNTFRYTYDAKGRLDTLVSPGGVREVRRYNDDDEVILRVDSASQFVGQPGGFPHANVHRDSLFYDSRGKVIEARTLVDTARMGYSALGALADGLTLPGRNADPKVLTGTEEFYLDDALGNRLWSWQFNTHDITASDSTATVHISLYKPGTGRDTLISSFYSGGFGGGSPVFQSFVGLYDGAGNRRLSSTNRGINSAFVHEDAASYYDALNRLRLLDKRACNTSSSGGLLVCNYGSTLPAADKGYFEEYRYDALGRRILLRSRSDSTCPASGNQCVSVIQRSVYDGDQVLYELQMPGADSVTAAQLERDTTTIYALNLPYGRVAYTHGAGIDRPLDVIRMGYDATWPAPEAVVPHVEWNGAYDAGSFDDGRALRCTNYTDIGTCVQIQWPAPFYGLFFADLYREFTLPVAWFGSLLGERRDASGQIYLRNRYYDSETGRFTQEDPIGLAGGLNAYGFASGDPVNYDDPTGLDPCLNEQRGNCTQAQDGLVGQQNEAIIAKLDPAIQGSVQSMMTEAGAEGKTLWLVSGLRSFKQQNALYAIGRQPGDTRKKVTWAHDGQSPHTHGLAVDVTFSSRGGTGPNWKSNFNKIGALGEAVGLEWGGRWPRPKTDIDHVQQFNWKLSVGDP